MSGAHPCIEFRVFSAFVVSRSYICLSTRIGFAEKKRSETPVVHTINTMRAAHLKHNLFLLDLASGTETKQYH